jgi:hypothetical protein
MDSDSDKPQLLPASPPSVLHRLTRSKPTDPPCARFQQVGGSAEGACTDQSKQDLGVC